MARLTDVLGQGLSHSFYPVPQEATGVGSAFEGWSPHAEDVVDQVLVPLSPPPGHAFHLELDTAGMAQRNFWVRVELLCTCSSGQLREDMLGFLHYPEQEPRREQEPSLLHTLCTGSYLDVEKTAQWFCHFVRLAWTLLPQSCHWRLTLLPSRHSCRVQLSKEKESLMADMIFGVQRGDSDIFVGSQPSAVGTASTTWVENLCRGRGQILHAHFQAGPPGQLPLQVPAAAQPQPAGCSFVQLHLEDCADAPAEHHAPGMLAQQGFPVVDDGHRGVPALLAAGKITAPLCHRQ
ncbi:hypothetical protein EK904_012450 [Melospiza melodia maxima]|nr:hypothetical protein EK904_012450 [Melospiza melodia maxima]